MKILRVSFVVLFTCSLVIILRFMYVLTNLGEETGEAIENENGLSVRTYQDGKNQGVGETEETKEITHMPSTHESTDDWGVDGELSIFNKDGPPHPVAQPQLTSEEEEYGESSEESGEMLEDGEIRGESDATDVREDTDQIGSDNSLFEGASQTESDSVSRPGGVSEATPELSSELGELSEGNSESLETEPTLVLTVYGEDEGAGDGSETGDLGMPDQPHIVASSETELPGDVGEDAGQEGEADDSSALPSSEGSLEEVSPELVDDSSSLPSSEGSLEEVSHVSPELVDDSSALPSSEGSLEEVSPELTDNGSNSPQASPEQEQGHDPSGRWVYDKTTDVYRLKSPPPDGITLTDDPIVINDFHERNYELDCPFFHIYYGSSIPKILWCILKNNLRVYSGRRVCFLTAPDQELVIPFDQVINIQVNYTHLFEEICPSYWYNVRKYDHAYTFLSHLSDFVRFYYARELSSMYVDIDSLIMEELDVGRSYLVVSDPPDFPGILCSSPFNLTDEMLDKTIEIQCKSLHKVSADYKYFWGSVGPVSVTKMAGWFADEIETLDKYLFQCEHFREEPYRYANDAWNVKYVEDNCKMFHFGYERLFMSADDAKGTMMEYFLEKVHGGGGIDTCVEGLDEGLYTEKLDRLNKDIIGKFVQLYKPLYIDRVKLHPSVRPPSRWHHDERTDVYRLKSPPPPPGVTYTDFPIIIDDFHEKNYDLDCAFFQYYYGSTLSNVQWCILKNNIRVYEGKRICFLTAPDQDLTIPYEQVINIRVNYTHMFEEICPSFWFNVNKYKILHKHENMFMSHVSDFVRFYFAKELSSMFVDFESFILKEIDHGRPFLVISDPPNYPGMLAANPFNLTDEMLDEVLEMQCQNINKFDPGYEFFWGVVGPVAVTKMADLFDEEIDQLNKHLFQCEYMREVYQNHKYIESNVWFVQDNCKLLNFGHDRMYMSLEDAKGTMMEYFLDRLHGDGIEYCVEDLNERLYTDYLGVLEKDAVATFVRLYKPAYIEHVELKPSRWIYDEPMDVYRMKWSPAPGVTFTDDPIIINDFHSKNYDLDCAFFQYYYGSSLSNAQWCILKNNIRVYSGRRICVLTASDQDLTIPFEQVINIRVNYTYMFEEICPSYWHNLHKYYQHSPTFFSHLSDFVRFYFGKKLSAMNIDINTFLLKKINVGRPFLVVSDPPNYPGMLGSNPFNLTDEMLDRMIEIQCDSFNTLDVDYEYFWGVAGPDAVTKMASLFDGEIEKLDKDLFQCDYMQGVYQNHKYIESNVWFVQDNCQIFNFGYDRMYMSLEKAKGTMMEYFLKNMRGSGVQYCVDGLEEDLYTERATVELEKDAMTNFVELYKPSNIDHVELGPSRWIYDKMRDVYRLRSPPPGIKFTDFPIIINDFHEKNYELDCAFFQYFDRSRLSKSQWCILENNLRVYSGKRICFITAADQNLVIPFERVVNIQVNFARMFEEICPSYWLNLHKYYLQSPMFMSHLSDFVRFYFGKKLSAMNIDVNTFVLKEINVGRPFLVINDPPNYPGMLASNPFNLTDEMLDKMIEIQCDSFKTLDVDYEYFWGVVGPDAVTKMASLFDGEIEKLDKDLFQCDYMQRVYHNHKYIESNVWFVQDNCKIFNLGSDRMYLSLDETKGTMMEYFLNKLHGISGVEYCVAGLDEDLFTERTPDLKKDAITTFVQLYQPSHIDHVELKPSRWTYDERTDAYRLRSPPPGVMFTDFPIVINDFHEKNYELDCAFFQYFDRSSLTKSQWCILKNNLRVYSGKRICLVTAADQNLVIPFERVVNIRVNYTQMFEEICPSYWHNLHKYYTHSPTFLSHLSDFVRFYFARKLSTMNIDINTFILKEIDIEQPFLIVSDPPNYPGMLASIPFNLTDEMLDRMMEIQCDSFKTLDIDYEYFWGVVGPDAVTKMASLFDGEIEKLDKDLFQCDYMQRAYQNHRFVENNIWFVQDNCQIFNFGNDIMYLSEDEEKTKGTMMEYFLTRLYDTGNGVEYCVAGLDEDLYTDDERTLELKSSAITEFVELYKPSNMDEVELKPSRWIYDERTDVYRLKSPPPGVMFTDYPIVIDDYHEKNYDLDCAFFQYFNGDSLSKRQWCILNHNLKVYSGRRICVLTSPHMNLTIPFEQVINIRVNYTEIFERTCPSFWDNVHKYDWLYNHKFLFMSHVSDFVRFYFGKKLSAMNIDINTFVLKEVDVGRPFLVMTDPVNYPGMLGASPFNLTAEMLEEMNKIQCESINKFDTDYKFFWGSVGPLAVTKTAKLFDDGEIDKLDKDAFQCENMHSKDSKYVEGNVVFAEDHCQLFNFGYPAWITNVEEVKGTMMQYFLEKAQNGDDGYCVEGLEDDSSVEDDEVEVVKRNSVATFVELYKPSYLRDVELKPSRWIHNKTTDVYRLRWSPPPGVTITDDPILIDDFHSKNYDLDCPFFHHIYGSSLSDVQWCILKNNIRVYSGQRICIVLDPGMNLVIPFEQVINIRVNYTLMFEEICPSFWFNLHKYRILPKHQNTFISHISDFVRVYFARELSTIFIDSNSFILKKIDVERPFLVSIDPPYYPGMLGSNPFNLTDEMLDRLIEIQCESINKFDADYEFFWGIAGPLAVTSMSQLSVFEGKIDILNKDLFQCEYMRSDGFRNYKFVKENVWFVQDNCKIFNFGFEWMFMDVKDSLGTMMEYFLRLLQQEGVEYCVDDLHEDLFTTGYLIELKRDTVAKFVQLYKPSYLDHVELKPTRWHYDETTDVYRLKSLVPPPGVTITDDPIIINDFHEKNYDIDCAFFQYFYGPSLTEKQWCILKNNLRVYSGRRICFLTAPDQDLTIPFEQVINIRVNYTYMFEEICPSFWLNIHKYARIYDHENMFASHLSDFVRSYFAKKLSAVYIDLNSFLLNEIDVERPFAVVIDPPNYPGMLGSNPFFFTDEMLDKLAEIQCESINRFEPGYEFFWGIVGPLAVTNMTSMFEGEEIDKLDKDSFQCENMHSIYSSANRFIPENLMFVEDNCKMFNFYDWNVMSLEEAKGTMMEYFIERLLHGIGMEYCTAGLDEELYTESKAKLNKDTVENFVDLYKPTYLAEVEMRRSRWIHDESTDSYRLKSPPPPGITYTDDPIVISDYHEKNYDIDCPFFHIYYGSSLPKRLWCILKNNIQVYSGERICFLSAPDQNLIIPFEQVINIQVNYTHSFEQICPEYWLNVDKYNDVYTFLSHISDFVRFYWARELQAMYFDIDSFILKKINVGMPFLVISDPPDYPGILCSSPFNLTDEMLNRTIDIQCDSIQRLGPDNYKFFWGSVGPVAVTNMSYEYPKQINALDKDLFQCEFMRVSYKNHPNHKWNIEYAEENCQMFHFGYTRLFMTDWEARDTMMLYFIQKVEGKYGIEHCVDRLDESMYTDQLGELKAKMVMEFVNYYKPSYLDHVELHEDVIREVEKEEREEREARKENVEEEENDQDPLEENVLDE